LLTPVAKSFFTDRGLETCVIGQQVFGGHGYIREWGMEQFVRDARIAQIYEGTNGIQAIDLIGRKVARENGQTVKILIAEIKTVIDELKAAQDDNLTVIAQRLETALTTPTMWLMQNAMSNADNAGAGSVAYMHLMALVAQGHMWVLMTDTTKRAIANGAENAAVHENKLITARYFVQRILGETASYRRQVEAGSEAVMALTADAF